MAAIAIWGTRASGGRYAAIAALTNILATVAAYAFYEFVFKDSNRRTSYSLIGHAFLGLITHVILDVTVIGKEYHDSRMAQREHLRRHVENVTMHYGPSSDSENVAGVKHLEK